AGAAGLAFSLTALPLLLRAGNPNAAVPWWLVGGFLLLALGAPALRLALRLDSPRADAASVEGGGGMPRGWAKPVGVFLLLGTAHSLALPLHEGADEESHFKYAQLLSRTGRLPTLPDRNLWVYEAIQPPLAYALLSPILRATGVDRIVTLDPPNPGFIRRGGAQAAFFLHGTDESLPFGRDVLLLHLARLFGLAFGAATVALACAIGAEVFRGSPALALACGWTVALLPQFAHVCASFNNDGAAAAAGAAAILLLIRGARSGTAGAAAAAGLAGGIAAVAKLTGLAFLPAGLLVFLLRPRSVPASRRFIAAGAFLGGAAVACGWLFLGNALLYGDPLENLALHRRVDPPMEAVPPPDWWKDIFSPVLFLSFFGVFGWATVFPGVVETALLGALLAAAAAGWTRRGPATRKGGLALALALLGLATEAAVNTRFHQPQGRHLFFVLGAIAPSLVGGWGALHPRRPERAVAAG
ncbi:MAG: glycosyltransferase family 39 protein, partial [Planctomycetota bacterium]